MTEDQTDTVATNERYTPREALEQTWTYLKRADTYLYGDNPEPRERRFTLDSRNGTRMYVYTKTGVGILPTIYRLSTPDGQIGQLERHIAPESHDNAFVSEIKVKLDGPNLASTDEDTVKTFLRQTAPVLIDLNGNTTATIYSDKFKTPSRSTNLICNTPKALLST